MNRHAVGIAYYFECDYDARDINYLWGNLNLLVSLKHRSFQHFLPIINPFCI